MATTMTFLTAQKELAAQLGLDYTQTDTATLLKRWLNLAYQDIVGWKNWSWVEGIDTVKTVIDSTETTLSVTASIALLTPTTVTFSSTIATSQTNRYIQFEGSEDWYKITAHTATTATATIGTAYCGTVALVAGDFTIRTVYYSLASTTEKVLNCRRAASGSEYLPVISVNDIDKFDPFTDTTGDPDCIAFFGQDSTGYWQFTPYPYPDTAILLEFRVFKKATELSGDTDYAIFPDKFNSVWLDRAKAFGYEFLNDDRQGDAFRRSVGMLERFKCQDNVGVTKINVIESIDNGSVSNNQFVKLPDEYGR